MTDRAIINPDKFIEEKVVRDASKAGMDNPYIGRDGRDYNSQSALETANRAWMDAKFPKIPPK